MKRRILMITYSLGGGGAERTLLTLAQNLHTCEVKMVSFIPRVEYALEGVDVETIGVDVVGKKRVAARVLAVADACIALARVKREFQADVALSFGFWANVCNVLSRQNERVVLSVRNNLKVLFAQDRFGAFYENIVRLVYPTADHVVSLSRGVGRMLASRYGLEPRHVNVIYNPVDAERMTRLSEQPVSWSPALEQGPFIVSVGRFVQQKGHWHLLRVFAAMRSAGSDARLVILGQGAYLDMLLELANGLGLRVSERLEDDADVYLPGFVANPYVFMRRARVFAFPSLWEGLGNSLVEAMAVGAFVCAADCDHGPHELVAGEDDPRVSSGTFSPTPYGILAPTLDGVHHDADVPLTRSESAWQRALEHALTLSDEERRATCARAQSRVHDVFALERIIDQWRRVL